MEVDRFEMYLALATLALDEGKDEQANVLLRMALAADNGRTVPLKELLSRRDQIIWDTRHINAAANACRAIDSAYGET